MVEPIGRNKLVELCNLFSCSMDELVREDMNISDEAYSDIRIETLEAFSYVKYAVISNEPEDDALYHVKQWAKDLQIDNPPIIGWDFPFVSQEQINVLNMHGYEAALILTNEIQPSGIEMDVHRQEKPKYIAITIKSPSIAPFRLIPNAYKVLMTHMKINGIRHKKDKKSNLLF